MSVPPDNEYRPRHGGEPDMNTETAATPMIGAPANPETPTPSYRGYRTPLEPDDTAQYYAQYAGPTAPPQTPTVDPWTMNQNSPYAAPDPLPQADTPTDVTPPVQYAPPTDQITVSTDATAAAMTAIEYPAPTADPTPEPAGRVSYQTPDFPPTPADMPAEMVAPERVDPTPELAGFPTPPIAYHAPTPPGQFGYQTPDFPPTTADIPAVIIAPESAGQVGYQTPVFPPTPADIPAEIIPAEIVAPEHVDPTPEPVTVQSFPPADFPAPPPAYLTPPPVETVAAEPADVTDPAPAPIDRPARPSMAADVPLVPTSNSSAVAAYLSAQYPTGNQKKVDLATLPPPVPVAPVASAVAPTPPRPVAPRPPTAPTKPPEAPPVATGHVNFLYVCKAEWIKLVTLRSTWWVIAVTIVVSVGLGAVIMASMYSLIAHPEITNVQIPPQTIKATDAAQVMVFGQLILSVLGVLFVSNEYSSGQIRSTLTAVPSRWPVLAAKTLIIAAVAYVISFVSSYGAVIIGWLIVGGVNPSTLPDGWKLVDDRFTTDGLQLVAGMALATMFVVVFALAVATIARNTAAGIAIVVVVLFIVPIVASFLHWDWVATAHSYMLDQCQGGLYFNGVFDFVKSLWVTAIWAVAPTVAAGVLLRTRDA